MDDSEEAYRLTEGDPLIWLEQGQGALLSADVLYDALVAIMHTSQAVPGIRERKLAYMQSVMLLTALTFENVVKGIAVAEKPTGWKDLRADSGHGISVFAAAVTKLSEAERDLLQRLQEYLMWAGRYPIPTKPARFAASAGLLRLTSDDRPLVRALFERLAAVLRARLAQRS